MKKFGKIAILAHANDNFKTPYVLAYLAEIWKAAGIEVKVLRGTGHFEPADALILHVDLTVIPDEYIAFCRRYPLVINGRVHDISKRLISSNILNKHDHYDGPVIVKTDANYGGIRENALKKSLMSSLHKKFIRKRWPIPWRMVRCMQKENYPVYQGRNEVPCAVWNNKNLVVEKFLPEMEGDLYCLRQWIFFGSCEANMSAYFPHYMPVPGTVVKRGFDLPVPDALRETRLKLGFDYGKFDYALRDGEVILYDTNRTPAMRIDNNQEWQVSLVTKLAGGLQEFSEEPAPIAGQAQGAD